MNRALRKIGLTLLILLVVLGLLTWLVAKSYSVQTYLAQRVAASMSRSLGAEVSLDRLEFEPFRSLILHGLLIQDQAGDTLIAADALSVGIKRLNVSKNRFRFSELELNGATFRLVQIDETGATNLDFLTNYFASEAEEDSIPNTVVLSISGFSMQDCSFSYHNPFGTDSLLSKGINLNDISLTDINARFEDFRFKDDTIRLAARSFSFQERTGFELRDLNGGIEINPGAVVVNDMRLETMGSVLAGNLALEFDSWSDFQEFTSAVRWKADFENSKIDASDIGYFVSDLYEVDFAIQLSGRLSGPIKDLNGRDLFVTAGERTVFKGNVDLIGLPDFDNTFIDLRVRQLSSDYADLERIRLQLDGKQTSPGLPVELERAGNLFFQGSFTGFSADFVAFGDLTTEAGRLSLDLKLQADSATQSILYTGNAATKNFDIGRLLDVADLGVVSASAKIDARSDVQFSSAQLDGNIHSIHYMGYNYRGIEVDGELRSQKFSGNLRSKDVNFDVDFSGLVDFSLALPRFDFNMEVYNANLTELKLIELKESFYFSTTLNMSGNGNGLSDFTGRVAALNSFLCYGDTTLLLKELIVSSLGDDASRKITLTSDIADMAITGMYKTDELYKGMHQMLSIVMPSLGTDEDLTFDVPQVYDFSINYKAPNIISGMVMPGLSIAPQTFLYGSFDNRSGRVEAFLRSGHVSYEEISLDNMVLNSLKQGDTFVLTVQASEASTKGFTMENINLSVKAVNDLLDINYGWFNADRSSSGDLAFDVDVFDMKTYSISLDTLRVNAKNTSWELVEAARIDIDTTGIAIDKLEMANREQRITASGKVGKDIDDEGMLILRDIDLSYLDSLGVKTSQHFTGIANADLRISSALDVPVISANSRIKGFGIDGILVGDIEAYSSYDQEGNTLKLDGTLTREAFKIANFKGVYAIGKDDPLSGNLFLDNFDLAVVNIFDLGVVDGFSGNANGQIAVEGDLDAPRLKGFIDFSGARFRVDYLNVFFEFSDRLRVEEDWFGIDYKPLYDQEGNKGFVVASAFHDNFSNFSYDISADVEQFLVLNTDRSMNKLFFGTARASGDLQIGGYDDFLEIAIDAKTARGTSVRLPLDESSDMTLENFVHFVSKESEASGKSREANLEGISMRLNIEATPDAEVQLIFDERSGDIMRGRGRGILTFEISPSGEFQMFGRYEITEGSYLFTLQNLVNKQFQVRPGGTVAWYGSPYEADLDIDAVYGLRTQLYPIMYQNRERYRTREDVNVILKLTDKLLNPAIAFSIELPQTTDLERSQLASVISTTQQLNQQVFALLILNRFLPAIEEEGAGGIGGLGSATTSDFVSTQISNWLSEISNDFEIGVNYRPGDQISNQEVAVALSTQLFNERVLVSGQFGVTSPNEMQVSQGQKGLVGDFLLEYLITEEGKVRLRVFNETNPYETFSTAGSIYTQGVGLVLMEDFDTIEEFFQKLGKLFTKDKAVAVSEN